LDVTFDEVLRYTFQYLKNKYMKKLLLLMLLVLMNIFVQAQDKIIMNDPNIAKRETGSFNAVVVRGPFKVYFSEGKEYEVAVSAKSVSIRDHIVTRVVDNELYIELDKGWASWLGQSPDFRVYLSAPNLRSVKASGAVDFLVADILRANQLALNFSGASDFTGKLDCKELKLVFTGASDMEAMGNTESLDANFTGASKMSAAALKSTNATLNATGASNIRISVSGTLKANATGASNITYYGNPTGRTERSTGASNIKKGN
jgi:hypothetical protein